MTSFISDLHNHLNGSLSREFLESRAKKYNCPEIYEQFVAENDAYLARTENQPDQAEMPALMKSVGIQFSLTHQLVRDHDDIREAVLDVVKYSTAEYIEIRTTPRAMNGQPETQYIQAFEEGLLKANEQFPHKKTKGLLSLDRTKHRVSDAENLLNYIANSRNNVLVGLDISGLPVGPRTLSSQDLSETISMTLARGLAIAIHMGEANTLVEKQDTDAALATLVAWKASQPVTGRNPLHGKVRLGHCIYLTEAQKKTIAEHKIPIEVCPASHRRLGWFKDGLPHPVTGVYKRVNDPVVGGTDDCTEFHENADEALDNLQRLLSNPDAISPLSIRRNHAAFRFADNAIEDHQTHQATPKN